MREEAVRASSRLAVVGLIALSMGACAPAASPGDERTDGGSAGPSRGTLGAGIVARVGDMEVTRAELERRALHDGVEWRAALDALIHERLLAREARSRGYAGRFDVVEATRRAMVRRLLADLERQVTADQIPESAVRARFEATLGRFRQPERRDIIHVVLPLPEAATGPREQAARERMEAVATRLAATPQGEREGVLQEFEADPDLQVEPVPGIAPTTPFDVRFIQGIFSRDSVGVVPSPVRAYDGWHVIWVRAIHPATTPDFNTQRDIVADELLARARAQQLEAMLADLRARQSIELDEPRVRTLLMQPPVQP